MNKTYIAIALALIALITLLAWAPWLTEEYTAKKILEYTGEEAFVHSYGLRSVNEASSVLNFNRLPFVAWVTTYDEGWLITFWGEVNPSIVRKILDTSIVKNLL